VPLIAVAVLAYAAGLLAGFGLGATLTGFAGLAVAAGALVYRRTIVFAGGAAVTAGALVAAGTRVADAHCQRAVTSAGVWSVVLEEAAAPGGFVHGRPSRCPVALSIAVGSGRADAGSTVVVRGQLTQAQRGYVVRDARLTLLERPSWRARWRARATRAVDAVFPADAPLARALLVADTRELSPEIRDRYAAAGLAHMLSISGLHVGIIAVALEIVFQLAHLAKRTATLASIVVVAVYVALIGAPEAAVRSAAMLGALGASRLLQRPTSPWAMLAIGAAAPLVSPRSVLEIGYQLSVIGVAGLIGAGALVRRAVPRRIGGWRRGLLAGLMVSTVATIVSAPLVAWTFGRISLVGPLTNLLAAPLMALAQPMLFLGLLLAPMRPIALLIGDAAHPLLAAFDGIAAAGAAIPGGWMVVSPTLPAAILAAVASVALIVACVSRFPGRPLVIGGTAVAALVWSGFAPAGSGLTEVHMIDVGQGDALALRTPKGRWVLFDAGRSWLGGDAGRSTVVPYLRRRGGALHAFVLSHPHADHVGGGASVIDALAPDEYWDGAYVAGSTPYRASLQSATNQQAAWHRVHPGDAVDVDGVRISFLAPDSAWTASLADANEASAVALVQFGQIRFLMTGDAEAGEEEWMLAHAADLKADVLKVGHHGSSTSSTAAFLDAVKPRVALISVGVANSYGHPSREVVQALVGRGTQVLRTDQVGTVVVRTDGHSLTVEAGGERWER